MSLRFLGSNYTVNMALSIMKKYKIFEITNIKNKQFYKKYKFLYTFTPIKYFLKKTLIYKDFNLLPIEHGIQ